MNAPRESGERTHEYEVDAAGAGERLDRWLHARLPELSRSLLQRYIKEGRVLVGGAPAKASATLPAGADVVVRVPAPPPPGPLPQDLPLCILHEDDSIIVIDKAPGMVVHPSPGVPSGGSVVNALLHHTDELSEMGGAERAGIVHRLDRETSGLLVIARTDAAHAKLAAQFKERTVRKVYVACVHGVPRERTGTIDLPIGRSLTQRKKMAIRHDEGGRASVTRYEVELAAGGFGWVVLYPSTGRTHQIRVHLKNLGHPIICDALYGREKKITRSELLGRKPAAGEAPIIARHALHAWRLSFDHPTTGARLDFEAPLPADLAAVRAALEAGR